MTRNGKPELDWEHVIVDRIDRYLDDFLLNHWPSGFPRADTSQFSPDERKQYYVNCGRALENDSRMYRRIMNRVKDAVDLTIKRVSWNFKTAVPQYYPRVQHLQLLLPICLVSDDQVGLALVVKKTVSGSYLGHTVLPLDWAYRNARLICRPDSDLLDPARLPKEQGKTSMNETRREFRGHQGAGSIIGFEGHIPYLPHEPDVPLAANRSLLMLRASSDALFTSGHQGGGPRDKVCVPRTRTPKVRVT